MAPRKSGGHGRFDALVREYRKLLIAGLALVAAPLAIGRTGLAPPWPKHVEILTALLQLVTLVIVFQMLVPAAKKVTHVVVGAAFVAFILFCVLYLVLVVNFTYTVETPPSTQARGFSCTPIAQIRYKDACPYLGEKEIQTAENNPYNIWPERSVRAVQATLLSSWLLCFFALTTQLASFILFQSKR